MTKVTPMIQQYLEIKEQYRDAILLYRMGDFYEMFFEDAVIGSRELEITLTSRDKHAENPIPMCGVPHHAVDTYIAKLLEGGHRVALCEQVEDPRQAKGLVRREVVRVQHLGHPMQRAACPLGCSSLRPGPYVDVRPLADMSSRPVLPSCGRS